MHSKNSILARFNEQVELAASNTAVISNGRTTSYGDVNAQANRLARRLIERGVTLGAPVGLCAEFSLEWVVGMLAILKAGGACVPLDPNHPSHRLNLAATDANLHLILMQEGSQPNFCEPGIEWLHIGEAIEECTAEISDEPSAVVDGRQTAFILYTSGSSGSPKGVMMVHESFVNLSFVHQRAFDLDATSRVLLYGAPSHGNVINSAITALLNGAAVVTVLYADLVPDQTLIQLIQHNAVSHLHMPPSALAALPVEDLPSLRVLTVGGEPLHNQLARRWRTAERRVFNTYGTTEANWLALYETNQKFGSDVLPIGQPIANMEAFIVDPDLRPVATRAEGEVLIAGIGLASGYLNRPDLTDAAFLELPKHQLGRAGEGTVRCYRTGDRGRQRADGVIELLGRIDSQVKIRGFRVELGEVEFALLGMPDIGQAAVVAQKDQKGEAQLVAYFVPKSERAPSIKSLRLHLMQLLPKHMVPVLFMSVDALPLLDNGKLDRRALPKPRFDRDQLDGDYLAPKNHLEVSLAEIWQDLLGLESLPGATDNFFDLGGHSLLASGMVAQIAIDMGKRITVRDVFQAPTIACLLYTSPSPRD